MPMDLLERLFSLKGKVALITGGYGGIGRLMAETYAEVGASVVLVARSEVSCRVAAEDISKRFNVKAAGKAMDVRDSAMVTSIVRETVREFGQIDILVNAAGVPGSERPVLETTDEDIDHVIGIDFRGTFLTSREVAREMVKRKNGKIINIGSIMARICTRNLAGYCAGKAAVVQLTRVMALELMRDNIQVNALCPGYFLTDFNRDFFQSETGQNFIKKMIPMNRVGDVSELKSTALYLATCPPFLTGADLYIDGGHTLV
jgi:NAD(P)-dependent dehydrogenase (short-subunit alcohol dehydrogenase family)